MAKPARHRERTRTERLILEGLFQGGRRKGLTGEQAEAVAEDVLEILREDEILRDAIKDFDFELRGKS